MTKEKKSFFEKLTGIQKINDESEVEINDTSLPKKEIVEDNPYKFPSKIKEDEDEDEIKEDFFKKSIDETEEADNEIEEKFEMIAPMDSENMAKKPILKKEEEDEIEMDAEGQLTIDVYQTDKDIVIKSTIAGVKPENLDVDINSEMVTIKGKRTQDDEVDSENYYYQECYWGPFSRSIILPVEIVTEKAEATMKNGILTIRLPKMEVAKTRKLQVRGF